MRLSPKTRSMLPIIEPIIEAFTRFNNPADIAAIPIIISAAFPYVTLSKEATVSPYCVARFSVD